MSESTGIPSAGPGALEEGPSLRLAFLGLAALVLILYAPTLRHPFCLLDDNLYLTQNPKILGGLNWESLRYAFTSFEDGSYLPLVWLSHAATASLFGVGAGAHHAVNAAFHLANTLLWFHLLHRTTRALGPSFLVAAIFAVHPLHVESVAWIAERKDVLSTCFWLLTTLAYVRHQEHPSRARLGVLLGTFLLGLLSKSMLVTLPLTLVLLDVWPLRRIPLGQRSWREIGRDLAGSLVAKGPLLAMSLACGLLTVVASRSIDAVAVEGKGSYPLVIRAGNALLAWMTYVRQTLWPSGLSPYYPHPGFRISWGAVALSAGLLGVLTWFVIQRARRHPYLLVGWGWFLITLLPVIGFLQVGMQAHADRYTYVSQFGLVIMAVWGAQELLARHAVPTRIRQLGVVLLLGALTLQASSQIRRWADNETLFAHALALNPDNGMAQVMLGDLRRREGRLPEALALYQSAHRNLPGFFRVPLKVAVTLHLMGRHEEAIPWFAQAHALRPEHPLPDQLLGAMLVSQGRFAEAEAPLSRVLAQAGRTREDDGVLLESRIDWGILLRGKGQAEASAQWLTQTLSRHPGAWRARAELGVSLSELGRQEEALGHLLQAQGAAPKDPEIADALGVVYLRLGRLAEAEAALEGLARLDPESPLLTPRREALARLRSARPGKGAR